MTENKELYEEKDLRTHVYDAPDTYAGGDNKIQDNLPKHWVNFYNPSI